MGPRRDLDLTGDGTRPGFPGDLDAGAFTVTEFLLSNEVVTVDGAFIVAGDRPSFVTEFLLSNKVGTVDASFIVAGDRPSVVTDGLLSNEVVAGDRPFVVTEFLLSNEVVTLIAFVGEPAMLLVPLRYQGEGVFLTPAESEFRHVTLIRPAGGGRAARTLRQRRLGAARSARRRRPRTGPHRERDAADELTLLPPAWPSLTSSSTSRRRPVRPELERPAAMMGPRHRRRNVGTDARSLAARVIVPGTTGLWRWGSACPWTLTVPCTFKAPAHSISVGASIPAHSMCLHIQSVSAE